MTDNTVLLKRLKSGDKSAEEELILNNMKLVGSIVMRFSGYGYDAEDLSQIGIIGLIKAIRNFDLSYSVKFSTYAVPVIAGEIKRFLRDDGIIKISRKIKENAMKGKKCREMLAMRLGREPTIGEIAKESGIESDDIIEAFCATVPTESITVPDCSGNEKEIAMPTNTSEEDRIIDRVLVGDILASLSKKERQIIFLRYFKGKTQTEIAERIGVSQVQISRIENACIKRLSEKFG